MRARITHESQIRVPQTRLVTWCRGLVDCTEALSMTLVFELQEAGEGSHGRATLEYVGVGFYAEMRESRVKEVRMALVGQMPKEPVASVSVRVMY